MSVVDYDPRFCQLIRLYLFLALLRFKCEVQQSPAEWLKKRSRYADLFQIWNIQNKNGLANFANPLILLAERTGLEPATPGVTGRYSNQLNYRSMAEKNSALRTGVPTGIRTPVLTVKGWCPRPLDDGDKTLTLFSMRLVVELSGIEPLTSCMPCKRSPSWAIAPNAAKAGL